jgi:hypothetical protein
MKALQRSLKLFKICLKKYLKRLRKITSNFKNVNGKRYTSIDLDKYVKLINYFNTLIHAVIYHLDFLKFSNQIQNALVI